MSGRRLWVAVGVLAVVATVVFGADTVAGPIEPAEPATASAPRQAVTGSSVCAVGDGRDGTALTTMAARPGRFGAGPASVEMIGFEEGALAIREVPRLFPGAHGRATPSGGSDLATWARWSGGPVAVWREWRWNDADDLPGATIAGGCARPSSDTWVIPGMSTAGGDEARLRLANPFRTDATVAVGFLTPEGAEDPLVLRNVTVPPRSVREVLVNESLPERADLAAVVKVASGRVSVEGYQIARAEIGGIDAGSLLSAAPAAAENWTIPWVSDGDAAASWLWIANRGERTASVELTLHYDQGGQVPDGLGEVSVPPGQLRRVDLRGTLVDDETSAAVTARSNGAPIIVSAGSRLSHADPAMTAFPVQLGAAVGDASWIVSGGGTRDRLERLRLVNPGGTSATVDVRLFNGSTELAPAELQGIQLPPGAARTVGVHEVLGAVDGWTAFVTASGGEIVVGRVGRNTGDAGWHFVATLGVPAASWEPTTSGLAASEAPGLVRRLGTTSGVRVPAAIESDGDPVDDGED